MKLLCSYIFCILTLIFHSSALYAYKVKTHEKITENAVNTSVLRSSSDALEAIGLYSVDDAQQKFPDYQGNPEQAKTVIDLIKFGSVMEDDMKAPVTGQAIRALNHFYSPAGNSAPYDQWLLIGYPTPDWALEGDRLIYPEQQKYSFKDAQEYLFNALTATDKQERDKNFGLSFQSLGHVLHLLQDMAQPQHTRVDTHLTWDDDDENQKWLENTSFYEAYTNRKRDELPYSGYASVSFAKAFDYWKTATYKGLANYSNRGFVSAGTNFKDELNTPTFKLPNLKDEVVRTSVDIKELYVQMGETIPKAKMSDGTEKELEGQVDFVGTTVLDYNRPTMNAVNDKTSSYSIFDVDLKKHNLCPRWAKNTDNGQTIEYQICELFTLNRFNFDAAHKFLIPRAVGYSAGLINYFFRGKLEINLPEEGVYAIVDHAVTNKIDEGFTKVKMKVKNVSPAIDNVAQNMNGGEIVLIARYHRNECYATDLSGESKANLGHWDGRWNGCESKWDPGIFGNQRPSWRNAEEMTISATQSINLGADIEKTLTFNFSKPIPLNAIDLSFQLVYKGQLGNDEAVAVSTKNISEPTFFSIMNMRDHFPIHEVMYPADTILKTPSLLSLLERNNVKGYQPDFGDIDVRPKPYEGIELQFGLNYKYSLPRIVTLDKLEAGSYLRVAYLGNKEVNYAFFSDARYWGANRAYSITPQTNEFQYPYSIKSSIVDNFRNTYYWSILTLFTYYEELSSSRISDYSKVVPVTSDNLTPKPVDIHF